MGLELGATHGKEVSSLTNALLVFGLFVGFTDNKKNAE